MTIADVANKTIDLARRIRRQTQVGDTVLIIDEDGKERIGILASEPRISPYYAEEQRGVMVCKVCSIPGEPAWNAYPLVSEIWHSGN